MYDNICKFLAETFPADIATWLLGSPIALTQLNPKELSVEPIRADSLIFLQSQELILHVEFQTQPKADIPFRMADYRLRAYRSFPEQQMHQVVVYLKPSQSPLVYQNRFQLRKLGHEFEIIRLWEQPVESFFQQPGLFPFAVLAQTQSPETTLRQVAQKIDEIPQQRTQAQISASTYVFSWINIKARAHSENFEEGHHARIGHLPSDFARRGAKKVAKKAYKKVAKKAYRKGAKKAYKTG